MDFTTSKELLEAYKVYGILKVEIYHFQMNLQIYSKKSLQMFMSSFASASESLLDNTSSPSKSIYLSQLQIKCLGTFFYFNLIMFLQLRFIILPILLSKYLFDLILKCECLKSLNADRYLCLFLYLYLLLQQILQQVLFKHKSLMIFYKKSIQKNLQRSKVYIKIQAEMKSQEAEHISKKDSVQQANFNLSINPNSISSFCYQINKQFKCSSDNLIIFACMNRNCQKPGLLCQNKSCQCYLNHKGCIKSQVSSIIQAIQLKSASLKSFEENIQNLFTKAIYKLSEFRDSLLTHHKETFNLIALSKRQKAYLNMIERGQFDQINGKRTSQIYLRINDNDEVSEVIRKGHQEVDMIQNKILKQIQVTNKFMEQFLLDLNSRFTEQNTFKGQERPTTLIQFKNSLIIKSINQETKIFEFFENDIQKATLLYRASQHDFQGKKFHQQCDNIPNLFILIQTKHGKVIGAYSHSALDIQRKNDYIADDTGKTFLFSLDNNQKLILVQNHNAIFYENNNQYALRFGMGSDLRISNKANQNSNSYSAFDYSYKNANYKNGDSEGYKRFTGSQTIYFSIKEWEVWKLDFGIKRM